MKFSRDGKFYTMNCFSVFFARVVNEAVVAKNFNVFLF